MDKNSDTTYMLKYYIKEDPIFKEINAKSYLKIKAALNSVGVYLNIENGEVTLTMSETIHAQKAKRHAGRKESVAFKNDENGYKILKYSDIVYMLQFKTRDQICKDTGISKSTFYRKGIKMKESNYYKTLDRNRLEDKEYLEQHEGNESF